MENISTCLFDIVHDKATKEYHNIHVHEFTHFTFFLYQELMAPPPLNIPECNHIIDQWLTNLNIIRHALLNFRKLTTKSGMLSTSYSPFFDGFTSIYSARSLCGFHSLQGSPSLPDSPSLSGSPSFHGSLFLGFTPLNSTGKQQASVTSTVELLPSSDNTASLAPAGNILVPPAYWLSTPTIGCIMHSMNITPTSTTKDKPTKRRHSATQSCLKRDDI